jgi:hypothetical protein
MQQGVVVLDIWRDIRRDEYTYRRVTGLVKGVACGLVITTLFITLATLWASVNKVDKSEQIYTFYAGGFVGYGFMFLFGCSSCALSILFSLRTHGDYYTIDEDQGKFEVFYRELKELRLFYSGYGWAISICYCLVYILQMLQSQHISAFTAIALLLFSPILSLFLGLFIVGVGVEGYCNHRARDFSWFIGNKKREEQSSNKE